MHHLTKATAAGLIIALGACGGATTPAARWSTAERAQIEQAFPGCEFVEDPGARSAGYACDLGTMRAYDLDAPEDHAALARRLAEAKATEPFTAPLAELVAREPLTIGEVTFAASIATYQPTEGTIVSTLR